MDASFRISASNLMIEKGRHHRPTPLPVPDRKCTMCDKEEIEDEIHVLINCEKYKQGRQDLRNTVYSIYPDTDNWDNDILF